jgi:excisionase family DNA binding protein
MRKLTRKKPDEVQSEVMTLRAAATYLNCSYQTLFELVHQGVLPGFRLGGAGNWRCLRSEIDQWIAARQVQPPPGAAEKPPGRGRRKPKA